MYLFAGLRSRTNQRPEIGGVNSSRPAAWLSTILQEAYACNYLHWLSGPPHLHLGSWDCTIIELSTPLGTKGVLPVAYWIRCICLLSTEHGSSISRSRISFIPLKEQVRYYISQKGPAARVSGLDDGPCGTCVSQSFFWANVPRLELCSWGIACIYMITTKNGYTLFSSAIQPYRPPHWSI